MKRAILVIAVALMAVAMLALSISAAFAEKPTTMTLTGSFVILGGGTGTDFYAGESGNHLVKIRNSPHLWSGDISGSGFSDGNWLIKPPELAVAEGTVYLEDATIVGVGTGDLTLGYFRLDYWIKSGSEDFRSIRGKGTATPVNFFTYDYELVVQIDL